MRGLTLLQSRYSLTFFGKRSEPHRVDRAGLFALKCMAMAKPFSNLRKQLNESVSDMTQSCAKLRGGTGVITLPGPRSVRLIQVIESMEPQRVKRG